MIYWRIEFKPEAYKQFKKLDKAVQKELQAYFNEKLLRLKHPKLLGKALIGNYKSLWRYRIGRFRVICDLQENTMLILIIKVAKRDQVYSN